MKKWMNPIRDSKGMMNIGMALGVAMVVATFMAPLGLYYLNMYNENDKARLRTQASEIVEGLGKLIYNAYATTPTNGVCPAGENVHLTIKQINISAGQKRLMIHLPNNKNMGGKISGEDPPLPPGGGSVDHNIVSMCMPSDGILCQEMLGRTYCIDMNGVEIAQLDENDPSSPQVAEVPVRTIDTHQSLIAKLRWKTAPLVAQVTGWMNKTFADGENFASVYAQGLESFGTTVDSPGTHSPIVTSNSFPQLRLRSKRCGNGDPAILGDDDRNACVSCAENGVVCVRYSLCLEPGSASASTAEKPTDCTDEKYFMQGMVAFFPDRI
jgi:hypothetical protein